ncbi:hypothetical protein DYB37_012680 [Aphanomyces astaci]|uniref:Uncharacterized protein n=1 Tax=Aphanomyces astaci TaxID=112090 RepID=A0A3R6XP98_APHAT|nr:hypothetical protein DYB37_012680 [Aphanomyces astaci]
MAPFIAPTLQREHGYIILVVVLVVFVNFWAGFKVGAARKRYNIKYPQANLRCSQATFGRPRHQLPERYRRLSQHSFEKKVAVVLYFLGSDGGYRETAFAFGMSKPWCVICCQRVDGSPVVKSSNVDQSTKNARRVGRR